MSIITLKELENHRQKLSDDFDELKKNIGKVEVDLGAMKSNLNAIYGAIQQVDKLIAKDSEEKSEKQLLTEKDKVMPAEKQAALNVATS